MNEKLTDHTPKKPRRYVAEIATRLTDIRAAQALRYRVFAHEMGATLHSLIDGLDVDTLDEYCDHLVVRDLQSDRIVGYERMVFRAPYRVCLPVSSSACNTC